MAERPRGFEYKHVECPQITALVDVVTNDHAKFYWELTGTQTVVAKESHLESGEYNSDNLYSVTTTERFVAIDFRRATDIPNLPKIKEVEKEYLRLCVALRNVGASPLDNYSTPPVREINYLVLIVLGSLWILPGVLYFRSKDKKHKKAIAEWTNLKAGLDRLLQGNKAILNIAT